MSKIAVFYTNWESELVIGFLSLLIIASLIFLVVESVKNKTLKRYLPYFIYTAILVVVGMFMGIYLGFYCFPGWKTGGAFKAKKFWQVWDSAARDSYKKPSQNEMFTNVLKSIASSVNDKYTRFLTPQETEEAAEFLPGNELVDEIGYMVAPEGLQITAIYYDSPAVEAGLWLEDIVLSIDDCEWSELSDKINTLGAHKFKVLKYQQKTEVEMKFEVGTTFKIRGVRWQMLNEIAYIQILSFQGDVAEEFENAVSEILKNKPKGLILDLRDNPGGDISIMQKIANAWLPGKILQVRRYPNGATEDDYSIQSKVGGKLKNLETIILTDENTASASEGLASALKYHLSMRVRLVGEKTFGKTATQGVTNFEDGSQLRVTKWEWTNPGGIKYVGGITPDKETSPADALNEAIKLLAGDGWAATVGHSVSYKCQDTECSQVKLLDQYKTVIKAKPLSSLRLKRNFP